MGPQASVVSGERLHLHHGPIDLIIGVDGPAREACFAVAVKRFEGLLDRLVEELSALRKLITGKTQFHGPVARRMQRAVQPHTYTFVTPMAAVAGAVADEILAAMVDRFDPPKAYVNNGGDIAFHLRGAATFSALGASGEITIAADDPIRGIATSGWRGRSHSLGIADAVTVLAPTAAAADVAATLIANAVDLPGHPAIARTPAYDLSPDSDLGERLVITDVGPLPPRDVAQALARGQALAQSMINDGLIADASLALQNIVRTASPVQDTSLKGPKVYA